MQLRGSQRCLGIRLGLRTQFGHYPQRMATRASVSCPLMSYASPGLRQIGHLPGWGLQQGSPVAVYMHAHVLALWDTDVMLLPTLSPVCCTCSCSVLHTESSPALPMIQSSHPPLLCQEGSHPPAPSAETENMEGSGWGEGNV